MFNKILTKILKKTGYVLETRQEAYSFVAEILMLIPEPVIIYNYIGEHNTKLEKVYETFYEYQSLLDVFPSAIADGKHRSRRELSIKPSQFGAHSNLIAVLAKEMMDKNSTLWIDAEDYYLSENQLVLVEQLSSLYGPNHLGITLQLKSDRCFEDAKRCLENGIKIRLCKGAYPSDMLDNHMLVSKARNIISEDKKGLIEIATMRDANLVMLAIRNKLPLQTLYGWHKKFLAHPYGLKIYVPFGTDWWPYIKRRIRRK